MVERDAFVRFVAIAAAVVFCGIGLWAFLGPRSFYDQVATFPPYNRHLFHDIGAFQIGIGATLLLALVWTDALLAALAGAACGAIVHFFSHVIDRDIGGRPADILLLGVLTAAIAVAAVRRARAIRR